ncbi:serine/threonine-protein kinase [Yinghuangia soli]|uniref:non-specific serine/threonine protein kinase n=1 Tax=Yinghuangia soli TaxID=2908204 RepID=A0AA41Q5Y8_9ACTN|nr:serine/threonine-protein kinase [Yinghuangia soli]MCF2530979.1 serine/threonine protein kinase [Yinghuangia soli]
MADQRQTARIIGGRFRLVGQLGSGGFGRVWRAHDEVLGVDVAVKEVWLPQHGAADREHHERLARAAREARNAAKLRGHPHIVAVHDVIVEDDAPWIVMDLVDGGSLAERLHTDGPLPAARVAEVAAALLAALKAAHEAGIVHRDIKPANVLLTPDGRVLLTDFGIAVHETDTRLTVTGGVVGSAEYMAPERFNGVEDHGPGDLFSLGVTLYEAVEGASPFRRPTPTATLAAVVLQEHPPLVRADPALAALITALLAKEPADRPGVDEASAMLRGARSVTAPRRPGGQPAGPTTPATATTPTTPTTPTTAAPAVAQRRKRIKLAFAGLLSAIAVTIAVAMTGQIRTWNTHRKTDYPAPGADGILGWTLIWAPITGACVAGAVLLATDLAKGRKRNAVAAGVFLAVFFLMTAIWLGTSDA